MLLIVWFGNYLLYFWIAFQFLIFIFIYNWSTDLHTNGHTLLICSSCNVYCFLIRYWSRVCTGGIFFKFNFNNFFCVNFFCETTSITKTIKVIQYNIKTKLKSEGREPPKKTVLHFHNLVKIESHIHRKCFHFKSTISESPFLISNNTISKF